MNTQKGDFMRHQRSEQRNEQRGSQGRGQGRSNERSDRSYGRQQREDESVSGWQDRDENRQQQFGQYGQQGSQGYQGYQGGSQNFQSEGYRPSESYRNDDYDMQSGFGRGDDYGSREYQGLGSSRQTSRDQQQGYSSSYGSRDLDYGSGSSSYGSNQSTSGYGRGSYNEDEYRSDRSSDMYGGRQSSGQSLGQYGSQQGLQGQQDQSQGRYAGRGPKGYKRSDERIKEEISDILTRDQNVDASEIEIEVKDGEVTLTGTVTERRMKHHAEDLIEKCSGVKDVTNNLRVQKESQRSQEGDGERKESKGTSATAGQMGSSKKSGTGAESNPRH
jgi:osmotically-inducible protein OsmY